MSFDKKPSRNAVSNVPQSAVVGDLTGIHIIADIIVYTDVTLRVRDAAQES